MRKRVLSHETGRKRARPARVAPASATARATVFLLVVCLVLAIFAPVRAFASIYNNPTVTWTSLQSCVVNGPNNEFDAALAIIERTNTKIQISEPMFVELSNEGTGGRFYDLAQSLKCAADEMPSTSDFVLNSSVNAGVLLYGADYVWWQHGITANDELLSGALQDYETILNGGHLGGGTVSPDEFVLRATNTGIKQKIQRAYLDQYKYPSAYGTLVRNDLYDSSTNELLAARNMPDIPFEFTGQALTSYQSLKAQGYNLYVRFNSFYYNNPDGYITLDMYMVKNPPTVESRTTTINGEQYTYDVYTFSPTNNNIYRYGGGYGWNIYPTDGRYVVSTSSFDRYTQSFYWNIPTSTGLNVYSNFVDGSGSGGGGGGGGDNNWPAPTEPTPDPPDSPDPIDPPTGGTPDVPDPENFTEPGTPQPSTPTTNYYINVQEPTNTTPTDYTPWLRAILNAINNLGDKLDDESLEIQRALNTFYTNLVTTLKNISGSFLHDLTSWGRLQMEWLAQDLQYSLTMFGADLTEYLDDLARWIVQNLNFDFPNADFDDSSIVYWLKRIWLKLGSDNINTRPTDPTQEPDGFLDWVRRVIQEFILGLGASASDVVSDIGDLLSRLFEKFPFSVPWEILGILQLLDAPAVTPRVVIDVPITIGSWHTSYTFDINLSPYDSAMATARGVFLILFCSWLLWLTPQVLRDLSPEDFL